MRMLTVMAALITAFGLSACHTIQGVGKDVQSGGEALEKSAK
ncbi:MAG TPA: entericidin A/B family lipoprotein [Nitrosospira sp.]|uniref:Entericidin B n=1 Tax=Nitrosospira multiformis TaxID=1231 RepID=A0A1H9Z485_9PROT|nr:entericidin A/B family lipoprotein [Nitrosospira multiformis]SES75679.1 entericidin B [Nitrosospira multiformis]HEU4855062.1 entericidin A/B family lipoprotein [Nitrosospira sp.]